MKRRQGRLRTALAAVLLAALFCAAIAEEAEVTVAEPVVESLPETSLEDLTPPASDEPGEIPAATEDDAIVLATEDDAALAPEGELPPEAAAENAVGAKKRGSAVITVAASTGETAVCAVRVLKAPASIWLNAKSAVLGFDESSGAGMEMTLVPRFPKKSISAVSYYGYNLDVISVSPEGVVTAKGVGVTRITARTFNRKKAKIWITVWPAPQAFELQAGKPEMCVGETRAATAVLPGGTAASLRFASDNPAVAAVDETTGAITAVGEGEANIIAEAFNGVSASFPVRVLPGPDFVAISETHHALGVKETFRLSAVPGREDGGETTATVTYVSSNWKVAAVYPDGTVRAKKKGSAVITATAPNGAQAACTIRVRKAPSAIRLAAKKLWMRYDAESGLGAEFSLSPALSKGSVSAISWSYDPAVVSVSPEGLVTAVGVGTTTITARTYNGKKAKCKVAVIAYDVPLSDYRAEHPVRVIAHRGGAGYWPENTLQAFAGAKSKGADAVELDVRTTRDGVQVVHHNVYFTYRGRKYAVARFTMDQLRTLVPGICTLDEALEVIADSGLDLWLEMKENANAAACVQAVRRWGLEDRTIYQSFYQDRLAWARRMPA